MSSLEPEPPDDDTLDYLVVIAMEKSDVKKLIPGSSIVTCTICGVQCWISPSGVVASKEHPEAKIVCMDCCTQEVIKDDSN